VFMFVLAFFILVSAPTFLFALDQIRRGVFFYLIRFDCTQKSDRELQISHELQSAQLREKRWSHGSLIVAVRPSDAPREKVNRQNRKQIRMVENHTVSKVWYTCWKLRSSFTFAVSVLVILEQNRIQKIEESKAGQRG